MKVTTSPAERRTMLLEVELPPERLQRQIDDSIRHLGRRTKVPGFRPGKIPRPVLELALGVRRDDPAAPNPIYEDAKEHLFEGSVIEALSQTDADIIPSIPPPEWLTFREGEGASYRVRLQLRPEVHLGDYTGHAFGASVEEIDDEKVERVVEQLRDQQAALVPVEDRGAQKDDYAVIGYRATHGGQEFEGGSAERMPLVIGAERMIPGFEDQLIGMREGEEKSFELRFPDDHPDTALAGEQARFDVTFRELREKRLPALDDAFAASLGPYEGLGALRKEVRHRLEASAQDRARHEFADRIIDYAVGNANVELPDLLVEQEIETMVDELRLRLAEQGIDYTDFLRVRSAGPRPSGAPGQPSATEPPALVTPSASGLVGPTGVPLGSSTQPPGSAPEATFDQATAEEALRAEYRQPAEQRVRSLLVISAIADTEGIEVPDPDVEVELERIRARQAGNPKLIAYFESARGRSYVRSTLRRSKTVESLVDRWLAAHPEVGPIRHLEDEPAEPSPTPSAP